MDDNKPKTEAERLRPTLTIKISGRGIRPETVRASDLAELITNLEDAITETAIERGHLGSKLPPREAEVSLVSIGEGSDLLGVAIAPSVLAPTNEIFGAIGRLDVTELPFRSYASLKKIHKQSVKLHWQIDVFGNSYFDFGSVVFAEGTSFPEQKIRTAKGETTIYGKLMRFGNASPTALVILDDGSRVSVEMTREMVKDLEARRRLFDRVGFEGLATWAVKDWKIIEFEARRITNLKQTGNYLDRLFDDLEKSTKGRWEGVDAADHVNRLRGRKNP